MPAKATTNARGRAAVRPPKGPTGSFSLAPDTKNVFNAPNLGIGLGLRIPHYRDILTDRPDVGWFEIISENFMVEGGRPIYFLQQFLEHYPVVHHGVSMSIGSTDPLDREYLRKLKRLSKLTGSPWFSDHLCWCKHSAHQMHNLLPLPYTRATADHVARKARIVQDYLEKPFLLENLSSYVEFQSSEMTEWEFLTAVVEKAGCGILLDVNNIYVSARNHEFDPLDYLRGIPHKRVVQIHVAGHTDYGTYVLDTHDHPVRDEVWDLYREACRLVGGVSMMLERDDNIPPFKDVHAEALKARDIQEALYAPGASRP
ncbi:DUF692 domain-containing protein [bacterium]|nr:DUF692 domain-containing protein [bacterium]